MQKSVATMERFNYRVVRRQADPPPGRSLGHDRALLGTTEAEQTTTEARRTA